MIDRLNEVLKERYVVEREVGAGGMATVYLADDVRHGRRVAVKVLRPELAAIVGAERFLGEIRTTAQLQHPHILPLFDSGESDGLLFFVTPYVEGPTVRDRLLAEGQLPVEEAVRIACEVADALDYAHRQGVIHRDIKPGNILLHDGRAVVADFGIALAVSEAGGGRITETGLSLGTPHYMSPEQASGERAVDARTDVYALGCVLYEMLAGEPPHVGPTAQAVLARVLTADPRPVTEGRPTVPAHVSAALVTALRKIPADRFRTATAFAEALRDSSYTTGSSASGEAAPAVDRRPPRGPLDRASLAMNGVLALAVVVLAIVAFAPSSDPDPPPSPWVTRVPLDLDPTTFTAAPALSPDGRWFAWATAEGIHVRSLAELADRIIPRTEAAEELFFSPDGRRLAYVREGQLRITALAGGSHRVVAEDVGSGFWSEAGWIYFTRSLPFDPGPGRLPPGTEIHRVREEGGASELVLAADSLRTFDPNAVSPDGTSLIGTLVEWSPGAFGPPRPGPPSVAVLELEPKSLEVLLGGRQPVYEPHTGHLLFGDGGSVMAVGYDPGSRRLTGEPFPTGLEGPFQLARDGTLWNAPSARIRRFAVMLDQRGEMTEVPFGQGSRDDVEVLTVSDDGVLVLARLPETGERGLWVFPFPDGPPVRLPGLTGRFAAWADDGQHVLVVAESSVYRIAADASTPPELVLENEGIGFLRAVQGGGMIFERVNGSDLDVAFASPSGEVRTLVGGEHNEEDPAVSPDGRWLAYESDETGRPEVYVMPFDSPGRGRRVSVVGGNNPLWGERADRLFFKNGEGELERLTLGGASDLEIVDRTVLFDATAYGRLFPGPGDTVFYSTRSLGPRPGIRLMLVRNWIRELLERAEEASR